MQASKIEALVARFADTDLAMPSGLDQLAKIAWAKIVSHLAAVGATYTGGCKAFRSPEEWLARDERYCRSALLVIVYEGGSVGEAIPFGSKGSEALARALHECGLFIEDGTCWYSGVYPC